MIEPRSRGVLDAPPEPVIGLAEGEARWRGMTGERGYDSAFSRRGIARVLPSNTPEKTEGAGNAGCTPHPQPRVQKKKAHEQVTTGTPKLPDIPCAMVLTAYLRALPGVRAC